jgi:hypothetical protein
VRAFHEVLELSSTASPPATTKLARAAIVARTRSSDRPDRLIDQKGNPHDRTTTAVMFDRDLENAPGAPGAFCLGKHLVALRKPRALSNNAWSSSPLSYEGYAQG